MRGTDGEGIGESGTPGWGKTLKATAVQLGLLCLLAAIAGAQQAPTAALPDPEIDGAWQRLSSV